MICQYCHQDVDDPCHNVQQMEQRAANHVERCERAFRSRQGMGSSAQHGDSQNRG